MKSIPSEVSVKFGKTTKTFKVIWEPLPHILVKDSQKELHGWYVSQQKRKNSNEGYCSSGKRECTAERVLINPYNGCSHRCSFCYTCNFRGYFELFLNHGLIAVFEDFHRSISRQLDTVDVISCGYLSPVTDPFQPLNSRYRLSEKIIKEFVDQNIPIELVTKGNVSSEAISLLKKQKHSFGQISILSLDENLRQKLVPGGATTKELLNNFLRLKEQGIFTVARIDPIIPLVTDDVQELKKLLKKLAVSGVNHVVASCLDLPWRTQQAVIKALSEINPEVESSYFGLYADKINGYYHANIDYRKRLFSMVRETCDNEGITFALCMEYEVSQGELKGLNREFSNVTNCEGIDVPVYVRTGEKFEPIANCTGACLNCFEPHCGIEDLAMIGPDTKKDWKLADYKRWSRQLFVRKKLVF